MKNEWFERFIKEFDARIAEENEKNLGNGEGITKWRDNRSEEDGGYEGYSYSISEGDGWTTRVTLRDLSDRLDVYVCLDGTPLRRGAEIPAENISSGESGKIIDAILKCAKTFGLMARMIDEVFLVSDEFFGISKDFSDIEKKTARADSIKEQQDV